MLGVEKRNGNKERSHTAVWPEENSLIKYVMVMVVCTKLRVKSRWFDCQGQQRSRALHMSFSIPSKKLIDREREWKPARDRRKNSLSSLLLPPPRSKFPKLTDRRCIFNAASVTIPARPPRATHDFMTMSHWKKILNNKQIPTSLLPKTDGNNLGPDPTNKNPPSSTSSDPIWKRGRRTTGTRYDPPPTDGS